MIHHFDHRWATYDGTDVRDTTLAEKQDPNFAALPRYWVPETEVDERLDRRRDRQWLLGWRDVSRSTDERTMIVGHTARVAVGHKMPLMFSSKPHVIYAILSSFALDYVARNKVGGTSMTYFIIKQLPVPTEAQFSSCEPFLGNMASWIEQRVRELSDTSHEITGMGVGPFQWEPERRALMRAELDGALFHLYGLSREDVDHMLDTFPIVRRKDEATYGEYRTKRLILDVYDKMAEAIQASKPYQTLLDPPPGRGHRHRANTGTRS